MTDLMPHLSEEAKSLLEQKRCTRLPPVEERRARRIASGWTFQEIGRAIGTSTSTAHRLETKMRRIPPRQALPYAALLEAWRLDQQEQAQR